MYGPNTGRHPNVNIIYQSQPTRKRTTKQCNQMGGMDTECDVLTTTVSLPLHCFPHALPCLSIRDATDPKTSVICSHSGCTGGEVSITVWVLWGPWSLRCDLTQLKFTCTDFSMCLILLSVGHTKANLLINENVSLNIS